MNNKQEIWIAMIISKYAQKLGVNISQLSQQLLNDGRLKYLEEYYNTLHLLSNDDILRELSDMAQQESIT